MNVCGYIWLQQQQIQFDRNMRGLGRVVYTQTLTLPNADREVVPNRTTAQEEKEGSKKGRKTEEKKRER